MRHEAAEALGCIAEPATVALLQEFSSDPEPVVADSCLVALDVLSFERSGAFQYADDGKGRKPQEQQTQTQQAACC